MKHETGTSSCALLQLGAVETIIVIVLPQMPQEIQPMVSVFVIFESCLLIKTSHLDVIACRYPGLCRIPCLSSPFCCICIFVHTKNGKRGMCELVWGGRRELPSVFALPSIYSTYEVAHPSWPHPFGSYLSQGAVRLMHTAETFTCSLEGRLKFTNWAFRVILL